MLFKINDATVSRGGEVILDHVDFYIKGNEKVAIVGANGSGKTTLLNLIRGKISPDSDDKRKNPEFETSGKLSMDFLSQTEDELKEKKVWEIFMSGALNYDKYSKERYQYEMECQRMFTGFGFMKEDRNRLLKEFSGGEQTKIRLIRLLISKPEILLLDEPTNHLDLKSLEWLERYIKNYKGAVIIVSHDRFFLDRTVDVVYELENGKLTRYAVNYTNYRKEKKIKFASQMKLYEKQQEQIAKLKKNIESFKRKPNKASFARAKKTQLDRIKEIPKPTDDFDSFFINDINPEVIGSKVVMEAEELKVGFDSELYELNFKLRRGQKVAVIGENGIGKTTLLKTVAGLIEPLKGGLYLGNNIAFGYFDQKTADISSEKTVIEHFSTYFPGMGTKELHTILGAYLFKGSDVNKRIDSLSGGEKSRLMLAELLTSRPNFLILDEPTNHMDIRAKENLEAAFRAYKGSMLFVSHDRYFIDRVATAILLITEEGPMYYPFGYEHYLSRLKQSETDNLSAMVKAKDKAMIEDLNAVPKPMRGEMRRIDEDRAYVEWKLKIAFEEVLPLKDEVELAFVKIGQAESLEEWENAIDCYNNKDEEYLEACLKWYDEIFSVLEGQ